MKLINSKKITAILLLGIAFFLVSFANNMIDRNAIDTIEIKRPETGLSIVPTQEMLAKTNVDKKMRIPFVEKDFVGFKEALAFKESQGKYSRVNTLGYLGKYQFGKSTLKDLHVNPKNFLKNPLLQEKAFVANLEKNKYILRKEIKKFNKKWVGGVKITESGILAAAHLGGAGAVQQYLWSYGKNTMSDAYGTSIREYLKKFSGYDLSNITPRKNPKVIE